MNALQNVQRKVQDMLNVGQFCAFIYISPEERADIEIILSALYGERYFSMVPDPPGRVMARLQTCVGALQVYGTDTGGCVLDLRHLNER